MVQLNGGAQKVQKKCESPLQPDHSFFICENSVKSEVENKGNRRRKEKEERDHHIKGEAKKRENYSVSHGEILG